MKKKWETPRMMIQEFAPNEYVAACYTLVCAIPEVRQRKLVMAPAQDILMGQMAGREIDIQRGMAAESMRMVSPMATAEMSQHLMMSITT